MYFVYILRCKDDTLYTGITTDIGRRFREHSGDIPNGAKYTRSHVPERFEAVWSCDGRSSASKLEYAVKKLRREQKLRLIEDEDAFTEIFGEDKASLYKRVNIDI